MHAKYYARVQYACLQGVERQGAGGLGFPNGATVRRRALPEFRPRSDRERRGEGEGGYKKAIFCRNGSACCFHGSGWEELDLGFWGWSKAGHMSVVLGHFLLALWDP